MKRSVLNWLHEVARDNSCLLPICSVFPILLHSTSGISFKFLKSNWNSSLNKSTENGKKAFWRKKPCSVDHLHGNSVSKQKETSFYAKNAGMVFSWSGYLHPSWNCCLLEFTWKHTGSQRGFGWQFDEYFINSCKEKKKKNPKQNARKVFKQQLGQEAAEESDCEENAQVEILSHTGVRNEILLHAHWFGSTNLPLRIS